MEINISLNSKSIESAIKQLEKAQKDLETKMLQELLFECCKWIENEANNYIIASTIGHNVKEDIINGWQEPEIVAKGNKLIATLRNKDNQAIFVEFGVGIVGSMLSHPNAQDEKYEYNVPSKYKKTDNSWIFNYADEKDIDIQANYINNQTQHTVRTRGSPAVMYAYNAIVNLKTRALKKIWQNIKIKYWG